MYSNTYHFPIESNNDIIKHKINGFLISIINKKNGLRELNFDTDLAKKLLKIPTIQLKKYLIGTIHLINTLNYINS